MTRIMFVCHGNICRSPMAEFIFRKLASERGCAAKYTVASSATSDEEIFGGVGNPVYPPAQRILLQNGIDPKGKRAVRLTSADGDKYDLFVGMDEANIRNMKRILKGCDGKIIKLLDLIGGGDVADPWYTGNFDLTYRNIVDGCTALLDHLENQ